LVAALELDDLVDEDSVIGKAEEILTLSFELRRDVQGSFKELFAVCEKSLGQVVFLLDLDAVL
jgi:hypothetical protein